MASRITYPTPAAIQRAAALAAHKRRPPPFKWSMPASILVVRLEGTNRWTIFQTSSIGPSLSMDAPQLASRSDHTGRERESGHPNPCAVCTIVTGQTTFLANFTHLAHGCEASLTISAT